MGVLHVYTHESVTGIAKCNHQVSHFLYAQIAKSLRLLILGRKIALLLKVSKVFLLHMAMYIDLVKGVPAD